jgi:phage tail-like protein
LGDILWNNFAMPVAADARLDPYKNFKFRLVWEDRCVYGSNQMRGMITPQVAEYRAGNDPSTSPRKLSGRTKYDPITLERGLTQDTAFHNWANEVSKFGLNPGAEVSLANFRKDIYLEFYNEAGQLITSYKIHRAWVSKYRALPKLGGGTNVVAIEYIEIHHEGLSIGRAHRTG